MNLGGRAVVKAAVVLLVGVSMALSATPPESNESSSTALGIFVSLGFEEPQVIYFAKVDEGESIEAALKENPLLASNEAEGSSLFLLNVEPGTYVAVAAAYKKVKHVEHEPMHATMHVGSHVRITVFYDPFKDQEDVLRTYFPKELIESTRVTVAPGSFAYLGNVSVKMSHGMDKGDEVQTQVQQILEGGIAKKSDFSKALLSGTYSFRGTTKEFRRDRQGEQEFIKRASKWLRDTEWSSMLAERLAELKSEP